MRIIVVGGGVIGLLTALECAGRGAEIMLVDQAAVPHPEGTSYDRHRIVRALHPGSVAATRAALAAHHRWVALEQPLAASFYHRTGALTVLPAEELAAGLTVMAEARALARAVSPDELRARFGQIRCPTGTVAILEREAGVLLADQALAALVRRLRRT